MRKIINYIKKYPQLTYFIFIGFIFLIGNIGDIYAQGKQISKIKKFMPHQEIGLKFRGIENLFIKDDFIGYSTDKNMQDPDVNKDFSEAQFLVAPTILDFTSTNHRYVIFDYKNEALMLEKIKELKFTPVFRSQTGIILAEKSK